MRALLLLAGALPFLAFLSLWIPALGPVADRLEPWFSCQCHRAPPRTLRIMGHGLPVCARCTGLYLGLLVAATVVRLRVGANRLMQATIAGGALLGLDVVTEVLAWRVPSIGARLFTGLAFALPAALAALQHARPGAR